MSVSAMLIGRLGNSMFQIAASIGYARKYGHDWAVQVYPHNNESAIHRVYPHLPKTSDRGIGYQEHPADFCYQHGTHYDQCHFNYHDIPNIGGNVFLRGFFQSWKYFEHCQDEVKKVFELPHVPGYENYVSIHVRRGDYVQHAGSFPPVTFKYISDAVERLSDIGCNPVNIIYFSDDIEWCKQLPNPSIRTIPHYCELTGERDSLALMASCGHHIIANSTFSWWSAYLGHNPNRIVISPSAETWFGPTSGVKQPVHDLILPNWIQIHTR